MSLVTETGSGDPTAESYAAVAFCDTYHANRNNTAWAALATAAKESALRLATDYMMQTYRERWNGTRVTSTQALDWPRYMVPIKDSPGTYRSLPAYYSYTSVPTEVQAACAILALKSLTIELAPDVQPPTTQESIGAISVSYMPGARQTVRYQAVDHLLGPMLKDGGSSSVARLARG